MEEEERLGELNTDQADWMQFSDIAPEHYDAYIP